MQKAQDAVQGCNVVAQSVKALHHDSVDAPLLHGGEHGEQGGTPEFGAVLLLHAGVDDDVAAPVGFTHETFVQLLKEIDSLRIDNEKSLQSYLYILTRERTIDFLRKWERRRGVLTDYENRSTSFDNFKEPEEIALTNLQLNKAVSILSDMPSIYRRTLVLRVKGYSIREIAQITNSSESNVKTRIHRARAILLKSFDT